MLCSLGVAYIACSVIRILPKLNKSDVCRPRGDDGDIDVHWNDHEYESEVSDVLQQIFPNWMPLNCRFMLTCDECEHQGQ